VNRLSFLTTGAAVAFNGTAIPAGISRTVIPRGSARSSTFGSQTVPLRVLQNPIVGEIARFDDAAIPPNWALCDGRVLAIAAYPKLFAVLGKSAGGDGRSPFALPRMTGARFIIAVDGIAPRSPGALATIRRGPNMAPDVSVPGTQVVARPAALPVRPPVAAEFPPAWPGTVPTAALFAEQNRARQAGAKSPLTPHFRGQPHG